MRRRTLIAGGAALATMLVVALTYSSAEAAMPATYKAGDVVIVPFQKLDQRLRPELDAVGRLTPTGLLAVKLGLVEAGSAEGVIVGYPDPRFTDLLHVAYLPDSIGLPVTFGLEDVQRKVP